MIKSPLSKNLISRLVFNTFIIAITILVIIFGPKITSTFKSDVTSPFSDVSTKSDKFEAINYLYDQEILLGNSDGTFKPANTLNRAEWATILVRLSGANPTLENYNNCFPDVKEEWFAPSVCLAKKQGWVKGYSAGSLKGLYAPNREVQDIEALVTLSRLSKWGTEETDSWYKPVLDFAKIHNIYDEKNPAKSISRDKIADVIFRNVDVSGLKKESYSPEDNAEIIKKPIYDTIDVSLNDYNDPYKPQALKSLYEKEFKNEIAPTENSCKKTTINIADQLENAFSSMGLEVPSAEKMQIKIRKPPYFEEPETTTKPTMKCGEEMEIMVRLGENFEVLPNSEEVERRYDELGKQQQGAHYLMYFTVFSFCGTDGKCTCFVSTEIISVATRVVEAQSVSNRGNCSELEDKFTQTITDIQSKSGKDFIPENSKWYTPDITPDSTSTPPEDDVDNTATGSVEDDDDNEDVEDATSSQLSYRFTCTHSAVYAADVDAYEYSLAGSADPADSQGNKTYAPSNPELPGGGVASIGGKLCLDPENEIPRCFNPLTHEVENNIDFIKTYLLSEYSAEEISDDFNKLFWGMTNNTVTCGSLN